MKHANSEADSPIVIGTPIGPNEIKTLVHRQNEFLGKVFGWMFCGLALTASIAYGVQVSPTATTFFAAHPGLVQIMLIAELFLVLTFNAAAYRGSPGMASAIFITYSAMNGVTLQPMLHAYTTASVFVSLAIASSVFLSMAIYGYVTKRDLTGPGSLAVASLWGIIVAMIVNLFLRSPAIDYGLSVLCVFLFIGITAYDTQRLKNLTLELASEDQMNTYAVYGALILYLDFMNLFLHILRLIGKRK